MPKLFSLTWEDKMAGIPVATGYIIANDYDDALDRAEDDVFDMIVREEEDKPETLEPDAYELSPDQVAWVLKRMQAKADAIREQHDDITRILIELEKV